MLGKKKWLKGDEKNCNKFPLGKKYESRKAGGGAKIWISNLIYTPDGQRYKSHLYELFHKEGGITEGTEYAHNRPKVVVGTGSRKAAAAVAKKLSKKAKRKQKVDK